MLEFRHLNIGDIFNTKTARWVKKNDTQAVCIFDGVYTCGDIVDFHANMDVILIKKFWELEE